MQPFPSSPPGRSARWYLSVVVLLLVSSSAGCTYSRVEGAVQARPFGEVQEGDMVFEPDPSDPRRARFRVTTTEPMICAVVWGEDDSFGRMNNATAMDGTGIEQHDVVLPDVEPGRQYTYVVQGTTADGTLYRSPVGTFTIDRADADAAVEPPDVEVGENLALDATVVDASSTFGDAFVAGHAVDGDDSTEWSTNGDGDGGSITIDLGKPQEIAAVEFVTRSMADGSAVTESFTVTVDGGEPAGPFPAGTPATRRISEIDATGRELRFDVESSTGGNVGAVEIRAYAPA